MHNVQYLTMHLECHTLYYTNRHPEHGHLPFDPPTSPLLPPSSSLSPPPHSSYTQLSHSLVESAPTSLFLIQRDLFIQATAVGGGRVSSGRRQGKQSLRHVRGKFNCTRGKFLLKREGRGRWVIVGWSGWLKSGGGDLAMMGFAERVFGLAERVLRIECGGG